jgi:general secretion pathway protein B
LPAPEPPSAAVPSERPSVPAPPDLPTLREIDAALRADLPPLRASMHVYDSDPARRFVLIDGRRVQEGDVLGESLFLIEIRRDGSVLEFRGRRFLLPRPG